MERADTVDARALRKATVGIFASDNGALDRKHELATQSLAIEEQFSAAAGELEKAAFAKIDGIRVQFFVRFCRCGIALAGLAAASECDFAAAPLNDRVVGAYIALASNMRAFKTWFDGAQGEFAAVSSNWDQNIDVKKECTSALHLLVRTDGAIVQGWNEQLLAMAKEVKDVCPARMLLDTPVALSNEESRTALAAAATKLHASGLLSRASECLAALKKCHDANLNLTLYKMPGRTNLSKVRQVGKLAIMVHWTVDEITNFEPGFREQLAGKAQWILEKLHLKGFGVTDHWAVLHTSLCHNLSWCATCVACCETVCSSGDMCSIRTAATSRLGSQSCCRT